ncbi:MAG: hypothetical protein IKM95_06035 [Bacteroidales bacterium]|nr:hypothetical protein [Bacteroidales bacterium]
MKKLVFAIGLVAMVCLASSCSKQKTCVCSYDINVLGVVTNVPLGEKVIESGTCNDLENAGAWNLNVGNLADATFHCERK